MLQIIIMKVSQFCKSNRFSTTPHPNKTKLLAVIIHSGRCNILHMSQRQMSWILAGTWWVFSTYTSEEVVHNQLPAYRLLLCQVSALHNLQSFVHNILSISITHTAWWSRRGGSTVSEDEGKPLKESPVEAGYY
jgi:hypothetical protein